MTIFHSYFNSTQLSLLIFGGLFFLLSIVLHLKNKERLVLLCLSLTAISIFSFAALLDPFLNSWDERFHALVAKNLMNHPLMPTLYNDPVVIMDYDRWDRSYIWLHKQPLFLWQMALSFKLFGISEFVMRLPNVVLGVVLVLITYRSGKLLVNKQVGYVASLFLMTTIYLLELIAGRQEVDHNDFSFLVYISLSIWCFIEYYYSKHKKWIYLIGLFSGMAILCKWLVGLLIYFGWGFLRLSQKKFKFSENKDILIALSITILIALPWQILTFLWYPSEAKEAFTFNSIHFSVPIEGHGGNIWYHFDQLNVIYGKVASYFILPAFFVLYKRGVDKKLITTLLSLVFIVYLFFSLAATKMPSFTIVVSMLIFIAFAALFDSMFNHIVHYFKRFKLKSFLFTASIIILVLLKFDVEMLQEKHTLWKKENQYTRMLTYNKVVFKSLNLSANSVLFNVKGRHYVEAMFYTGLPAYNFVPSKVQYLDLKKKGRQIVVFNSKQIEIPDYLKNDRTVLFIQKEIQGYE